MNRVSTEWILRAIAIGIAVVALIDPVLTRSATLRPRVVVLEGAPADRDLANDVEALLRDSFDVSRQDHGDALAYVIAGDRIPDGWQPADGARVFSVGSDPARGGPRIQRVDVPRDVALDSVVPMTVDVTVPGPMGPGNPERRVSVALLVDGVRVMEEQRTVTDGQAQVAVPLRFVPSAAGLVRLRVEATMDGRPPAVADVGVQVETRVWRVLAFDGRPSYAATFVRRALEADPRFDVVTRSVTSRTTAAVTGSAPASLTDARALSSFDVVIVGVPETLEGSEVAALDRYLRERGGAVVLLPEGADGQLLQRLTGVSTWRMEPLAAPVAVSSTLGAFAAADYVRPATSVPWLTPVAQATTEEGMRDVVWRMPVGSGRLIVSGAVDGWRSRGDGVAGFASFWTAVIAGAAEATPARVSLRLTDQLLTPGELVGVSVSGVVGASPDVRISRGPVDAGRVRVWPTDSSGMWHGEFRAPVDPGAYTLSTDGASRDVQVVEATERVRPDGAGQALAALLAWSHQGEAIDAASIETLPSRVAAAVPELERLERWRPMRSLWWLVPFAACTTGEWWFRRRRGQR